MKRPVSACEPASAPAKPSFRGRNAARVVLQPLNLPPGFAIGHVISGARLPRTTAQNAALIRAAGIISGKSACMAVTFDKVADIIAETCDIPRETIKPESHAINDLQIDSLDFLDIAFAIDKAFGIKLPLEQWTQEVNDGKATTDQYFVLSNLCSHIDQLVAAKSA
jgi:acyl carrier protein